MCDVLNRLATEADLHAINAIYNHYVLHSACTYQLEPDSAADRRAWFDRHGHSHPVIVAEQRGDIVGWGSLSPFRAAAGYRHSVENSVYVRHDCHSRGIGGTLLRELIGLSRQLGHHTIIAIIDAEQAASIALHAKHGFREVARLREVGHKFDRWQDVVYMQLMLM